MKVNGTAVIRLLSSLVIAIVCVDTSHSIECLNNEELILYLSPKKRLDIHADSDLVYSDINDVKTVIRSVNKYDNCKKIKVIMEDGYYQIDDTIIFESDDSGFNNRTIEYNAESSGGVVFSGLANISLSRVKKITIGNYESLNNTNLDVYKVDLPVNISDSIIFPIDANLESKVKRNLPDFFVNGTALKMSRWPLNGWINAEQKEIDDRKYQTKHELTFNNKLPNIDQNNGFLLGFPVYDWAYEYKKIENIYKDQKIIEISSKQSKSSNGRSVGRWALYNLIDGLNTAGKYYLDKKNSKMYFSMDKGAKIYSMQYSSLDKPVIQFDKVKNVSLNGVSIIGTTDNGVKINNSNNIQLVNTTISYVGKNGIHVTGGKEISIIKANINNTGSSGVYMGGGDRNRLIKSNHEVSSSRISYFGTWDVAYKPGISIFGVGVNVNNNVIFNGPHSGIILSGNNHKISNNEIYNVAHSTGDVGVIYSGRDWTMRGNIIENNYIHSIPKNTKSRVIGIYLDDLFSGAIIKKNILDGIEMCVLIGGGRDNVVENNIFVNCEIPIWADARGVERAKLNTMKKFYLDIFRKAYVVKNNKEYSRQYPALDILLTNNPLEPIGNKIYDNVYSCGTDLVKTKYKKRKDWYEVNNNKCFSGEIKLVHPGYDNRKN